LTVAGRRSKAASSWMSVFNVGTSPARAGRIESIGRFLPARNIPRCVLYYTKSILGFRRTSWPRIAEQAGRKDLATDSGSAGLRPAPWVGGTPTRQPAGRRRYSFALQDHSLISHPARHVLTVEIFQQRDRVFPGYAGHVLEAGHIDLRRFRFF